MSRRRPRVCFSRVKKKNKKLVEGLLLSLRLHSATTSKYRSSSFYTATSTLSTFPSSFVSLQPLAPPFLLLLPPFLPPSSHPFFVPLPFISSLLSLSFFFFFLLLFLLLKSSLSLPLRGRNPPCSQRARGFHTSKKAIC